MSDFTISVTGGYLSQRGNISSTVDIPGEEYLVISYPITGDPDEKHLHAIPLSGIAFRMEMLGSQNPIEIFELTIRELNTPSDVMPPRLYPSIVSVYYQTSTELARILATDTKFSSWSKNRNSAEIFLNQIRTLLRGDDASSETLANNPLTEAVTPLRTIRTSSLEALRLAAQRVPIEDTPVMEEIRQLVASKAGMLTTMTDMHAHRAMEMGAYFYARQEF